MLTRQIKVFRTDSLHAEGLMTSGEMRFPHERSSRVLLLLSAMASAPPPRYLILLLEHRRQTWALIGLLTTPFNIFGITVIAIDDVLVVYRT